MSKAACDAPPREQVQATALTMETLLRWSLRLFGSVDLLAALAVLMPTSWMIAAHRWCGLGAFPEGPLPVYLARSTSMLYAFHGALLWRLSFNVTHWRGVIVFMAWGAIVMGILLIVIDATSGIPRWWLLLEGPAFAASGAWLLWVLRGTCDSVARRNEE